MLILLKQYIDSLCQQRISQTSTLSRENIMMFLDFYFFYLMKF